MYNMRAERMVTDTGTWQLWHVLNHAGTALCGRVPSSRTTPPPDSEDSREEYCTPCMQVVAAAAAPSRGRRGICAPSAQ
jgi:hypothetical protein